MRIGSARPSSAFLGAREPVDKTDAGAFPAPRTVAVSTRFSVVDSVGPAGRHPRDGGGVDGGAASPALCRVGCRQGRGGGLRAGARRARWPRPGGADLPDLHLGTGGAGRLAGRRSRHPGGDGGHRPVLEAGGAPRGSTCPGGGGRTPPAACRSRPLKLGAARSGRRRRGREQPRQRRDRPGLPDGLGPASETGRCKPSLTSGQTPVRPEPAPTWWIWAGQQCTHARGPGNATPTPASWTGQEATPKDCGVGVARLPGKAGHRPRQPGRGKRGNPSWAAPPAMRPAWWRAGPPSTEGRGRGRSRRSTRRSGEPATGGRAAARSQHGCWKARRSPVNTGAPLPTPQAAEARVLGIQAKLHRWATDDPDRRFDDLFNLVCDPAFLLVGWRRVRGNKGARSAGVDGETAYYVESVRGEEAFLAELRASLKDRSFRPLPVRERLIPKPGTTSKWRRLGIATVRDRVVQAALKLVLEPIWEADFQPCSYGFRPGRRAQDAIAELHHLASHSYEWVLDGDITACFDELSHSAMLERVRERIADRRVLGLVKAFLKAGILSEDGAVRDTVTGTPQGGILSPLLSNLALSVLDEHIIEHGQASAPSWVRERRRRQGQPNYRIVRYADDFVVLVAGTRDDTEAVREQVAAVLATIGLRLSPEKTTIAHIDEGIEFLGWRIQRHQQRGSQRRYVYTYPSRKALAAVKAKVRTITGQTTNQPLAVVLHRLNWVLRGWANYFRHGASAKTFAYLDAFSWRRVIRWLCRKHQHTGWRSICRRWLPGWRPTEGSITLFDPGTIAIRRYRYRGAAIPSPWAEGTRLAG